LTIDYLCATLWSQDADQTTKKDNLILTKASKHIQCFAMHWVDDMTAEIAIMNKEAVALAADSAITLREEEGQKIFTSINKILTLSKYQPTGVMVPYEPMNYEVYPIVKTKKRGS